MKDKRFLQALSLSASPSLSPPSPPFMHYIPAEVISTQTSAESFFSV